MAGTPLEFKSDQTCSHSALTPPRHCRHKINAVVAVAVAVAPAKSNTAQSVTFPMFSLSVADTPMVGGQDWKGESLPALSVPRLNRAAIWR